MPRRPKRKQTKKSVIKANDDLAREINKLKGKCERCGKDGRFHTLHWAHVYGRQTKCIRWEQDNCLLLCYPCHKWQHENPLDYAEWFDGKFPGRRERIKEKLNHARQLSLNDYIAVNVALKETYQRLCSSVINL